MTEAPPGSFNTSSAPAPYLTQLRQDLHRAVGRALTEEGAPLTLEIASRLPCQEQGKRPHWQRQPAGKLHNPNANAPFILPSREVDSESFASVAGLFAELKGLHKG
jgi:hypothetical protein